MILTLIGMVLVNYAHMNMLGLKTWRRTAEQAVKNYQQCMSVVERFGGDTEKLFGQWQRGRDCEIKLTDKDRSARTRFRRPWFRRRQRRSLS